MKVNHKILFLFATFRGRSKWPPHPTRVILAHLFTYSIIKHTIFPVHKKTAMKKLQL